MLDEILVNGMFPPPIRTYAGSGWMVPRWRIEQILHERLTEAGVQGERGVELVDFRQDEGGVTARLSTGPIRAEYLVDTDGGRSTVRNALGVGFSGETDEATKMVFFEARITDLDDRSRPYRFTSPTDPGCGIGLTPLAGTGSPARAVVERDDRRGARLSPRKAVVRGGEMRSQGRGALVTGGASGIGRATSLRLAREGASVVVTGVQDEPGNAVAEGIRADGGEEATYEDYTAAPSRCPRTASSRERRPAPRRCEPPSARLRSTSARAAEPAAFSTNTAYPAAGGTVRPLTENTALH